MSEVTDEVYRLIEAEFGTATAQRFYELFSGSNIYISKRPIRERRNSAIISSFREGDSIARLAADYGLSASTVRRILEHR